MRTPEQLAPELPHWDTVADLIDEMIDFALNLSQSGHPGGSRSKVHALVTLLLSGAMRWDISHPEKRFSDRFVLVAGHTNPVVYATLAVFNEALRRRHAKTGDDRYASPLGPEFTLLPEDLLSLRRNKGLPGHAEMEGKTLFFKANTGPTGHGAPIAAGEAMALKHAGAGDVRVFAVEGEGGHTAGVHHEVKNSAFGLGLGNLCYLLDWNDCGIDKHHISSVVHGGPKQWFEGHGWRVAGAENGSDFAELVQAFHAILGERDADEQRPGCVWFRTTKGRGYIKTGAPSHGAPHKYHSDDFWTIRDGFSAKYNVEFIGRGEVPATREERTEQTRENIERALSVLDGDVLDYLSDRLAETAESVPDRVPGFHWDTSKDPLDDPALTDPAALPEDLFFAPGEQVPNRKGFANYGAYANAVGHEKYGRPLFLVCAADLAESTNIAGFGKGHGGFDGYGWYERDENKTGAILPQEITEFANSGIVCGAASVNFADKPLEEWRGYMAGCSTYGSFSYLKYGPMRLFSQMCQDSQIKLGKVIWVAGHSGPETAEDSRTHFGIFAPGVTSLFPTDRVINLHPWEANEVPVVLAAALATEVPIVAIHLTRPPIAIPDRAAMGADSHLDAAKGAYILRDFDADRPRDGTVIVRGTSTTASLVELMPWFDEGGPNIKVVAAISHALFRRQSQAWTDRVLPWREWADSMVATNTAARLMGNWIPHAVAGQYVLSPDHDNRWRTGGTVEEIVAEAQLDPASLRAGIERFVADRDERHRRLADMLGGSEPVGA